MWFQNCGCHWDYCQEQKNSNVLWHCKIFGFKWSHLRETCGMKSRSRCVSQVARREIKWILCVCERAEWVRGAWLGRGCHTWSGLYVNRSCRGLLLLLLLHSRRLLGNAPRNSSLRLSGRSSAPTPTRQQSLSRREYPKTPSILSTVRGKGVFVSICVALVDFRSRNDGIERAQSSLYALTGSRLYCGIRKVAHIPESCLVNI